MPILKSHRITFAQHQMLGFDHAGAARGQTGAGAGVIGQPAGGQCLRVPTRVSEVAPDRIAEKRVAG